MAWSILVGGLLLAYPAHALTIVERSTVNLQPGERKSVFVSIKNQTSYVWQGGANQTALYIYGNSSPLYDSSWLKKDLPTAIAQSTVKPGEIATASFTVKAPTTPGTYTQRFLLGTGTVWHKYTVIEIAFVVSKTAAAVVATTSPSAVLVSSNAQATAQGGRFANQTAYQASIVSKGGIGWQTNANGSLSTTVQIKNIGKQVWRPSGTEVISLYALSNDFKDTSWLGDYQVAKLPDSVSPGATGNIVVTLHAPNAAGQYQENFELRVNGVETIVGSQFVLSITVIGNSTTVAQTTTPATTGVTQPAATPATTPVTQTAGTSGQYLARLLLKPAGSVAVTGNATVSLTYGIKNAGTAIWNKVDLKLVSIMPDLGSRLSGVQHDSWPSIDEAKEVVATVNPGNLSLLDFKLKAPAKSGSYTVRFAMEADGQPVQGGEIDIPVTVTADGYIAPETSSVPSQTSNVTNPSNDANLPGEPIIRVGLYATNDDTMVVRGLTTGMNLTQGGSTVCSVGAAQEIKVVYDRNNHVYKASGSGCTTQSTQFYVAVATDGISPLEVTDISRPVSWLPGANDNKFRGKLELRYTPKTDLVWVINELPIETYLKGIAETSDVSPMEFQKTLLTAARTYAMYHVQHGTKHADEYYTVDAKYDQVYRGYGQEARSPNIVAAVDATRGLIVTYNGQLAITPYFSRSDGRTRDWSEVWGGDVPWCKGVAVPEDAGKTLWGHGVGLSASGALEMAAHEGKTYDQILKYFYTGIDLTKIYR